MSAQPKDRQPPDGDDASLQDLTDAFSEMLKPDDGTALDSDVLDSDVEDESSDAGSQLDSPSELGAPILLSVPKDEEDCEISPKSILEAMLFVGHPENDYLSARYAASIINGVSPREVEDLIGQLKKEYDQREYAYEIVSAGAGFRIALRAKHERIRNRFYGRIREARLSQAAIEVLALVAYKQPTTSATVSKLRGHPSGSILAHLVRRQLLRMERPEQKPRTPTYHTTARFLKLFGLDSLEELPDSQQMDA